MGRALQGQRRFGEAQHYLARAIEIDPMDANAHFLSGLSAYATGDYDFAIIRFTTSVDITPKSAPALLGLARAFYRQAEFGKANRYINESLRFDPQSAAALLLRARILSREGNTEGALEELHSLLTLDPNNQISLVSIAVIEMKRGNHQEAAIALANSLKKHPESAMTWAFLGRAKMKLGDFPGAEDALRNAMSAKRKGSGAKFATQLAETLLLQGKVEEAKTLLARLPRFGGLGATVQKAYGDAYCAEGRYELAASAYRAAFNQTPDCEDELIRVEASLSGDYVASNHKQIAEVLGKAISSRLERNQDQFLEQEWHELVDKYEPITGDVVEA
jgi:tetratricopeptide (TPR) repeat protein